MNIGTNLGSNIPVSVLLYDRFRDIFVV